MRVRQAIRRLLVLLVLLLILRKSVLPPADELERIRVFTRNIEFDYVGWVINASFVKATQTALSMPRYLTEEQQYQVVRCYLSLVEEIRDTENVIELIYSDPAITNPQEQAESRQKYLDYLIELRSWLGPLCESVLQQQLNTTLAEVDLATGGQPLPPVLYHITPLPLALIISPREVVRQDHDISLISALSLEEIVRLEGEVELTDDVSALVENVGGVGAYPTMVMSTTDVHWLVNVTAHEWTHNYLTLRPLGLNYFTSPELRTMNETTANIVGGEVRDAFFEIYPEYLAPKISPPVPDASRTADMETEAVRSETVDFREEMHETRVTVDQLLLQDKVEEAETYMEERRQFLWDYGYRIRRLNQAYFAFHGAYADAPGGAAGADPVGPAVRELRQQSASLADFLNRISWMTSFEALERAVEQ